MLQPFSILSYGVSNPLWLTPNVAISIGPVPGFSATSYAISAALPTGLSFNTNTGVISGTPTVLTATTILVIAATLASGGTSSCNFAITVSNEPPQALAANTASAIGLVDSKLIAQTNWISSAEAIINNNNLLGKHTATLILGDYIGFPWVYQLMTALNYTVTNLTPQTNDFEFISYFGQPQTSPGTGPFNTNYEDFSQYPASVRSMPIRRVLIGWSPFVGWSTIPWIVPPFYPTP